MTQGKRIFVALSGGVDSSVTAALLKREGCDVTGVFIKVWQPDFVQCTWREDRRDAMRVCIKLDIPFRTFDLSAEYKRDVIDYMLREYAAGRTPNPDVVCNTHIKFGAFLSWALREGADCIATGHYVKVGKDADGPYSLATATDEEKDQSYFLWGLTQRELKHSLFPIGHLRKKAVRALAARFGLPTARKKDSQGLCFVGKVDMVEFLSNYLPRRWGNVVNSDGAIVGTHQGAHFYTLGQRRGLTITEHGERSSYYVVGKNANQNTLTVAHEIESVSALSAKSVICCNGVNWISGHAPYEGERFLARARYREVLRPCSLAAADNRRMKLVFPNNAPLLAPGQSLVLYRAKKERRALVGGGVIVSAD